MQWAPASNFGHAAQIAKRVEAVVGLTRPRHFSVLTTWLSSFDMGQAWSWMGISVSSKDDKRERREIASALPDNVR